MKSETVSLRAQPSVRENKQLQERQTDAPLPGPHTQLIIIIILFYFFDISNSLQQKNTVYQLKL